MVEHGNSYSLSLQLIAVMWETNIVHAIIVCVDQLMNHTLAI
jgi:hypothetical protein